MSILIRNARVLQTAPHAVTILENQDILIRGNRIEAIQATGKVDASHFETVIDAGGQLAMPGLINTHSHVPMVMFRGLAEDVDLANWFNEMWALEANLTPEDVYWGMMLGIAEMIEAGVTAVADHYWYEDMAAKAVEEAGTRALLGWAMFGSDGPEAIEKTGAFVRDYNGAANGRITTIMAPHAPYTCDDDFLRAVSRKAEQIGARIHTHASETAQQTQDSLNTRGKTPIEVLRDTGVLEQSALLAHICGATESDLDILEQYETTIAHCPKTYLKLAMGLTPVPELRERGIAVGLGTDGAVSNNTLDIWESMRLMAMTQKERMGTPTVLPKHEVLYIATQESATVYGQPEQLGSLEVGKLADVILVDLTATHHQPLYDIPASLIYSARASDVQTVICDGAVLMRDRVLLTLNKADIIAHLREGMGRLSEKVPGARIQVYE
ncbi:amidohydrolase [Phototrophicus methaneseepsis]|uniref:Amidohydrolase n=1 Tax=Phototrophicus methaneseepsis TaxID=2710758 RepID=A0A7S8ECV0_9CHLR|nr:amidohydrolase [Phototrophicus methaneseepsis]QPC84632.1 amidohydrolase [Phototrophicus methaneseepsis]